MKGYKMTQTDGTDYYSGKIKYVVGSKIECPGDKDGKSCAETKPDGTTTGGMHICLQPHKPLSYNAKYPWRLIEVEYDEADVLGSDDDKVRVSSLRVIKELHPFKDLGLPNSDKLETLIGRIQKIKWKCQTVQRKKKISALVRRYAKELSTNDKKFIVKTIKYYSVKEWASLRASLRDSLRASLGASLRDSLRDSLWDSLGASLRDSLWDSLWASLGASLWDSLWDSLGASLRDSLRASLGASFRASQDDKYKAFGTEMDIVLSSAVLMGITDDGTAHVVMPGKDEMNEKNL